MIHIFGRGVVGRRAEEMLSSTGALAHSGDFRRGCSPGDIAVLAHSGPQFDQAAEFIDRGVHVVAIGDDIEDNEALLGLGDVAEQAGVSLIVGAATSPGLSGLLARWEARHFASIEEIHVAVHGTAGPDCAVVHHQSMRGRVEVWRDREWIQLIAGSGRELCWFPEPIGGKDCYRSRSIEPALMRLAFDSVARISHRRSARRRDRLTAGLPMLSPPPSEGAIGGLRVELRGTAQSGERLTRIAGMADHIGTASAAVAVAFAGLIDDSRLKPGLQVPGAATLPTLGLLAVVQRLGVRLEVFTGIPQP